VFKVQSLDPSWECESAQLLYSNGVAGAQMAASIVGFWDTNAKKRISRLNSALAAEQTTRQIYSECT